MPACVTPWLPFHQQAGSRPWRNRPPWPALALGPSLCLSTAPACATSFSTPPESRSLAGSRSRCHRLIHHIRVAAIARNSPLTLALLSWAAVVNAATACTVVGATSPRGPSGGRLPSHLIHATTNPAPQDQTSPSRFDDIEHACSLTTGSRFSQGDCLRGCAGPLSLGLTPVWPRPISLYGGRVLTTTPAQRARASSLAGSRVPSSPGPDHIEHTTNNGNDRGEVSDPADHPGCRRIGSSKRALHMSRRHKNIGRILACHPSHRSGRLHFWPGFFSGIFFGPREVGGTSLFEVEFGRTQLENAWTESRVEPASTCQ
jgi:hypothetical protein